MMNVRGQIVTATASTTTHSNPINACIHLLGNFAKGSGDAKYRLSAQLPVTITGAYDTPDAKAWFPNSTTTTSDANGAFPNGRRHLLGGRYLLAKTPGGGNQ